MACNVGNTGQSTLSYIDRQIVAGTGGFAYVRSTPAGRSAAWEGFPSGAFGPSALSGISTNDYVTGVVNGLAVATDFSGNVAWENVNGTGAGSGPIIPASNTTYTADPSLTVSAAPGGWVTIGDTVVTPPSTASSVAHLLLVTTGGTVTDLATLGNVAPNTSWSVQGGPNGAIYQSSTYNSTTMTSTNSPWVYVPYASPGSPVNLAADTSADNCQSVFSSDAICNQFNSVGAMVDVLVPLNGSADSSLTLPGAAMFGTGTATQAAWIDNTSRDIQFEPWSGGAVTTVSAGSAIPSADLASDGSNLIFGAALKATSAGLAKLTPPSTTVTTLNGEPIAATEAGGLSLTAGRVSWSDDHAPGATLAAGAGPLWDRTLTNSAGTLTAGTSANLVATDASDYSLSSPAQLSISGRRSLFVNNLNDLVVRDPAASSAETVVGTSFGFQSTVSGSRALWFDNTGMGAWKLRDLNTGTDANLSTTIANLDSATLWGNYIAFEKSSDGSVWRWDISNLSNAPVQVLAAQVNGTTIASCNSSGGPFVAGDYVAWAEDCYDSGYTTNTVVSGYQNVTAASAAVNLSPNYAAGLSGSYVATMPGFAYPGGTAQNITVTRLGTTTTSAPGSATGPLALDGSTIAWIDANGAAQAASLTHVPEAPRYLGNGVAPSALAVPGTWNGEWDASGALSTCSVAISQGSTAVATLPCNTGDMPLGEAVVSWNGKNTGGTQVADGSYTWTLTAAGPDGALAAPNGSAQSFTGSISVTSPLTITTTSLPNAVVNSPYNASIAAAGGKAPYTYSVPSGTLPAGLSLNSSTGAITGTPTAAGSSNVTFQVTDSATPTAATVTKALSVTVNPAVSISSTSLPPATQNVAYDQWVTAAGGTTPYTFTLASGSNPLPAGLSLSSAGEITGTPTTLGSTPVTFKVTDSTTPTAGTDSKALTITVNPPPPNPPTGVTATAGVDSATLSWTAPVSGPPPTSYVVMSNPPTTDVSSGSTSATVMGLTPGVSYTFTVESVDAGGNSAPSAPSNAVVPTSVAPQNTQSKTGTDPSASTSTTSSSGTVTITANAVGTGTVTVSTYPSNPVGGFQINGTYFDVSITSGSSFTSLKINVCGLQSGSQLSWWNPAVQAMRVIATADSSGCVNFTITATTSPSLADLNGTVFAVGLPSQGYTMVASDGGVFALGGARYFGSLAGKALNAPIVGIAMTPDGGGYWLVSSDGGVFNFGDATYYGSKVSYRLNAPIVGIASTPSGNGYWLVGSDGGIFNFGDAVYYGGEGGHHLNQPIVGMAADPTTGGYWLVASDGGIFNFNAPYEGSTGNRVLNKPVVGMAVDKTTGGYWLVASDGGIFNFNAPYEGSTGNRVLNKPVVGMASDPNTGGYWLFASDGGVFNFVAPYMGSLATVHLNKPIVAGTAG